MKSEFRVRPALPNDTSFIYEALKVMVMEQKLTERFALSEEALREALFGKKPFAEVLIALHEDLPIGFVLFSMTNRNFTIFNGPGIYVHDLYVIHDFRRRKIGTKLFNEIKKIAQERQCDRIDWVVLKHNHSAVHFYKKATDAQEVDYINYLRIKI